MISVLRSAAYMKRYWRLVLMAFLSLTAATMLSLSVPQILRNVIDVGLPQSLTRSLFTPRFLSEGLYITVPRPQLIFVAALLLLGLSLLRAIVAFGQRFFGERLSQYFSYDLRNDFYHKVEHLPFAYHDQVQMGQIITRAISDVDAVRMFFAQGFVDGINIITLVIGVIIAMFTLSSSLALVALIPIPFIMAVALTLGFVQVKGWRRLMERMSALSNLLEENVIGIQVLRAFNRQGAEARHWAVLNQRLYDSQVGFTQNWSTAFPLMAFLVAVSTTLMLWQGGPRILSHELSIGTIVALNGYILLLANPIQRLGFLVQQAASAASSAARVYEILDAPVVLGDKPGAINLPRIEGYVRFEDVSIRYREGGPEALHHVDFEAQPGQVIGLVGPTGAGKSSIINLIPRFYDVTEGRVTIDGHDVRDVTLHSLRSQIGLVLQETMLFTATIRENIAYGLPDASEVQIVAAAKAADAHRFIGETPDGYDTKIGERGMTLSGGQRQRLAIARALLIDPRILILDDATSSVDTRTEDAIQQALSTLMAGRVTFIIAQRLSAVLNADLILVIDHGQIVDRGTHDELIARDGLYREIYREQMEDQEQARARSAIEHQSSLDLSQHRQQSRMSGD